MDLAYEASVQVVGKEHTHKGTVATGDQFVASEDYVKKLKEDYDAYACEMEGAAIAVCSIPLSSSHFSAFLQVVHFV